MTQAIPLEVRASTLHKLSQLGEHMLSNLSALKSLGCNRVERRLDYDFYFCTEEERAKHWLYLQEATIEDVGSLDSVPGSTLYDPGMGYHSRYLDNLRHLRDEALGYKLNATKYAQLEISGTDWKAAISDVHRNQILLRQNDPQAMARLATELERRLVDGRREEVSAMNLEEQDKFEDWFVDQFESIGFKCEGRSRSSASQSMLYKFGMEWNIVFAIYNIRTRGREDFSLDSLCYLTRANKPLRIKSYPFSPFPAESYIPIRYDWSVPYFWSVYRKCSDADQRRCSIKSHVALYLLQHEIILNCIDRGLSSI